MNKIECPKVELLNKLLTTEQALKGSRGAILAMERTLSFKKKSTRKKKAMKKQKKNRPKQESPKKKAADKGKCFHCNSNSHQTRNYLTYLASLKNKKDDMPSKGISNLLVIEINLTVSFIFNWVIDSSSSTHLCTSMQHLEESRRLRKGKIILWV